MRLPDLTRGLTKPVYWMAAVAILVSFVLPPDGIGFSSCAFKNATGAPCLGCGMTRGVTSISHLRFEQAWSYHPFAYVFWPFAFVLAFGVLPGFDRALRRAVERFAGPLNLAIWAFAAGFLAYGIARLIVPGLSAA